MPWSGFEISLADGAPLEAAGSPDWFIDAEGIFNMHLTPIVATAQDVPEPGTLGVVSLGLLGMGIARRRARKPNPRRDDHPRSQA